jgi:hypothetical protein
VKDKTKRTVPLGVFIVCVVLVGTMSPTLAGLIGPPTFNDVDEDHPFFDEIEWMAGKKISEGYPDGTYRPGDPVTRQAMSAFMQRLYDVQDDLSWTAANTTSSTFSISYVDLPGASTSVIVPPGTWANISARFGAESMCNGPTSHFCRLRVMIQKNNTGPFVEMSPQVGNDFAFDAAGNSNGLADAWESHSVERLAEGYGDASGATFTVKVQYSVTHPDAISVIDDWSLVAETDLQPSTFIPS